MRTRLAGTLLIILGAAIAFCLVWIFRVATSLHLVISLLLIISGAIIGFVVEWFVDETFRPEKEQAAPTAGLVEAPPAEVQPQANDCNQELEAVVKKVQQYEAELQQLSQQISAREVQLEGINAQFDLYRKHHPDQLTRIKGIGPVYQRKLREVGINSFAQLAASDPSHLRQVLGIKNWQRVNIEAWVSQAHQWDNGSGYD